MATASIYEVASKAGVSTATVSRAFTRPELVSPKTLARVREAADELNYSITRAATTMKTGQTFRVAILLSDPLSTWFSSSMLDGVNEVLHPAGYDFSIYRIVDTTGRKEFFDTLPIRKNVDAVITSSFGLDAAESERLHSIRIPVVGINPISPEGLDASVGIDDARAATLAAEHLLSLGHTRIAYVRTNPVSSLHYSAQLRADGFCRACMSAARPVTPTIITLSDLPGRMDRCMAALLGMNPRPTAIACQEDNIALRLLFRLASYGLEVPGDLSLVGFDDGAYAEDAGLTTIHQNPVALGMAAAQMALTLIDGRTLVNPHETAPTHLVMRSSTAAPRD